MREAALTRDIVGGSGDSAGSNFSISQCSVVEIWGLEVALRQEGKYIMFLTWLLGCGM
jgi:hypothetical protein